LKQIFPEIPQRRCIWHIYQNVQTEAVKHWDVRKGFNEQEKNEIELSRLEFTQI